MKSQFWNDNCKIDFIEQICSKTILLMSFVSYLSSIYYFWNLVRSGNVPHENGHGRRASLSLSKHYLLASSIPPLLSLATLSWDSHSRSVLIYSCLLHSFLLILSISSLSFLIYSNIITQHFVEKLQQVDMASSMLTKVISIVHN